MTEKDQEQVEKINREEVEEKKVDVRESYKVKLDRFRRVEGKELREVKVVNVKNKDAREGYKKKLDKFRRVEGEGQEKEEVGKGEEEKTNIQPREALGTPNKPVPTPRRTEGGTGLYSTTKVPKFSKKKQGMISHDIRIYFSSQSQVTRSTRTDSPDLPAKISNTVIQAKSKLNLHKPSAQLSK